MNEGLYQKHKNVADSYDMRRMREQKTHNARSNISALKITVSDYVMIRAHARRDHNQQREWRGRMSVKDAKSALVFVVADMVSGELTTVQAHRMVLYTANNESRRMLEQFQERTTHYDATSNLVNNITGLRKRRGGHELMIKLTCLDDEKYISGNHWMVYEMTSLESRKIFYTPPAIGV